MLQPRSIEVLRIFSAELLTRRRSPLGSVSARWDLSGNFLSRSLVARARDRAFELHREMQRNRSKRYRAAAEQVDGSKSYNLADAVSTLKKFPPTKFDQTVTVSFRLGVDPKQSDQMVRGTCPLPHGSGKRVRVLVFAEGAAAKAAIEAGAEHVGFKGLIQKVQEGFQDFDVAVATPAAMAEVRKLGKVLGPRGLMPNPKTGTVTDDTAKAVQEVKAGRVEFKLDKNGNVAVPVGKFSFA